MFHKRFRKRMRTAYLLLRRSNPSISGSVAGSDGAGMLEGESVRYHGELLMVDFPLEDHSRNE